MGWRGKKILICRRYVTAALLAPQRSLPLAARIFAQTTGAAIAKSSCVKDTPTEIAARVRKIVAKHLGVDAVNVTPGAEFYKDLGAEASMAVS